MFSYEHLAAFCATVENSSYSKAAKALGKDRTTIREQIKALEDSYAIQLFDIQGKQAVVTQEGQAFYRQAKLLVRNSELLNARMMESYKTPVQQLNIYHDIMVPNALILHIEQYLAGAFPHIKVHWLHRNRDEALREVTENVNALAIMQNRMDQNPEMNFDYYHMGTDKLALYCHPNHPLTTLNTVTAGDLQLAKQYVSENHIHAMPDVFAVSVDQHVVSNNDVLLNLLQHDGWAFLSKDLASPLVESKRLVELHVMELGTNIKIGLSLYSPMAIRQSAELKGLRSAIEIYATQFMS